MRSLRTKVIRSLKPKNTAPWLARLAFFVLIFQISAIDHHMHFEVENVTGDVGASSHSMHCHGAVGSCADSSSDAPSNIQQPATLPPTPAAVLFASLHDFAAPADALIAVTSEPPRI